MRRSEQMDPVVAAELEELDAVLSGERQDPVLALIADEARAAAPKMPPGLELRLQQAAAEGFAEQRAPKRPPLLSRVLMPAGGLVAAALVVVVIASNGGGSTTDDSSSSSVAEVPAAAQSAAGGTVAGDAAVTEQLESAAPVPSPSRAAKAPAERKVQRAADLTISTPLGKLQDTSDEVARTADRLGGYVERSDVNAGGRRGQATFDLRIPTDRLDEALATLSRLGHVRSRTQQSEDITERFVSARTRLTDARSERQALLRALAAATTTSEIDSIKARLEIANSRIAAAKGDLAAARRTANMAHVGVTVVGTGEDEGAATGGDDWTPGKALDDAVHVLSVAAGVAIVALAGLVPAALLALLALAALRGQRRRRREVALDGGAGTAV